MENNRGVPDLTKFRAEGDSRLFTIGSARPKTMTGGADGAGGNEFRLGACTYNVNSVRHVYDSGYECGERYDARSESTMRARDACLAARSATMAL